MKSYPRNRQWRMLTMPHCLDNRLTDGKVVSPTQRPHFTPQKHYFSFLVLISATGWVNAGGLVQPEKLGKFKNSPHRVSNPRSFGLYHSALTTTLARYIQYIGPCFSLNAPSEFLSFFKLLVLGHFRRTNEHSPILTESSYVFRSLHCKCAGNITIIITIIKYYYYSDVLTSTAQVATYSDVRTASVQGILLARVLTSQQKKF
jgi:hypothetical protein